MENFFNILYIGNPIRGKDEDIIKISNIEDIQNSIEDNMNIILESNRYISQTKQYNYILIITILNMKYSLLFISIFNMDPIVGILNINF